MGGVLTRAKRPREEANQTNTSKKIKQDNASLTLIHLGDCLEVIFSFLTIPDLLSLQQVNNYFASWLFSPRDYNWTRLLKEFFPFGHDLKTFGEVLSIVHELMRRSNRTIHWHLQAIPNYLVSEPKHYFKYLDTFCIPWQEEIIVFHHAVTKKAFFIDLLSGNILWKTDGGVESISFDYENRRIAVLTSRRTHDSDLDNEITIFILVDNGMTEVDKIKTIERKLPGRFSDNFYYFTEDNALLKVNLSGQEIERFKLPNDTQLVLSDYANNVAFLYHVTDDNFMQILRYEVGSQSISMESRPQKPFEESCDLSKCYTWHSDDGNFLIGQYDPYVWSVNLDSGIWNVRTIPSHEPEKAVREFTFSQYDIFVEGLRPKSENSDWPDTDYFDTIVIGKMSDGSVLKQIDATPYKWCGCCLILDENTILFYTETKQVAFNWRIEKVVIEFESLASRTTWGYAFVKPKSLFWNFRRHDNAASCVSIVCTQVKNLL